MMSTETTETEQRPDEAKFWAFMEESAKEVATWPAWKKAAADGVMRRPAPTKPKAPAR